MFHRVPALVAILCALTLLMGFATLACRGSGAARPANAPAAQSPKLDLERVAPEFQPSLEAVQAAIQAGDDRTARAILDQVLWRAPRGRTLDIAQAFERILDGREAVQALHLELVDTREEPLPGPGERHDHVLELVVRNDGDRPVELSPGPSTLITEHERLDVRATFERASETHTYEKLATLELGVGEEKRLELLAFFLEPQERTLAERLVFRFEMRSGGVRREGRDLPAMHFPITSIEVVRLSEPLAARSASTIGELEKLLESAKVRTADALDLVLRLPVSDRPAALDAIRKRSRFLPETDVKELIPALRWITGASEPGGDPSAWRAWLDRANAQTSEPRAKLVLPVTR